MPNIATGQPFHTTRYELLTGQLPHGYFQPPSKHGQVPRDLDRVVMRSLEATNFRDRAQLRRDQELLVR